MLHLVKKYTKYLHEKSNTSQNCNIIQKWKDKTLKEIMTVISHAKQQVWICNFFLKFMTQYAWKTLCHGSFCAENRWNVMQKSLTCITFLKMIHHHVDYISLCLQWTALRTKHNKFQIQLIMNVDFGVLVTAHFPILCNVFGIFSLNFIVTNPMVHGLL